jgi:mono/diheme cytochrome c family protein
MRRALTLLALLAAPAFSQDEASQKGKQVYQKWCSPCHAPGANMPGTAALELHYKGSKPAVLEERRDLTPAMVKGFVRNGVYVMPRFRKTEISDAELDAVAAYLIRQK